MCCNVFAKDKDVDLSFLNQPNVVWGRGEAKKIEDADNKAFEELSKKLGTEVHSTAVTNSTEKETHFNSKTVSTSSVRIFNSKQVFVKEHGKYVVYRYLVLDDPYNGYTFIEPTVKKEPQPVKVIVNQPSAPVSAPRATYASTPSRTERIHYRNTSRGFGSPINYY